jgi:predicted nucleic-acid-binding protein
MIKLMLMHWRRKTSVSVLGIDTNVIVRFLTSDDEEQTPQAQRLLSKADNHPIFISMLVLAEAFTVLTKVKRQPDAAVLDSFRLLLRSPALRIERPDLVASAIASAAKTRAGFADALIALQNSEARCVSTATFDIRAMRLPGMNPVRDFI